MGSSPRKAALTAAVFELERNVPGCPPFWRVTLSLPHREGTLSREWSFAGDRIDVPALTDMAAFMARVVTEVVETTTGTQLVFFANDRVT